MAVPYDCECFVGTELQHRARGLRGNGVACGGGDVTSSKPVRVPSEANSRCDRAYSNRPAAEFMAASESSSIDRVSSNIWYAIPG